MQAAVLIKNGPASKAFEIQELADPKVVAGQIRINVDAFGLNFADVMARLGLYQDCPPLPAIIGYETVGTVDKIGAGVTGFQEGQRVLSFTRFGGYATKVCTDARGVVPIPDTMPNGEAVALGTQYCTAWYAAAEMVNLHEGDQVLVQSAAGGVGTALVQWAKHRGCYVFGTASTKEKLAYAKEQGVDFPINYTQVDFKRIVEQNAKEGKLDVVFDAVGGASVKKGMRLLAAGGRMVCYGASSMSQPKKNIFKMAKTGLDFGFYHPAQLMMGSHSLLGVNMLRIADFQPLVLKRCLENVVKYYEEGVFRPKVGGSYTIDELAQAHEDLGNRKTMGKLVVEWE